MGGKTQRINNTAKKSYVITSAGKHTSVRYLNKKQMEEYSDLSQKVLFNIMNAERMEEITNMVNITKPIDGDIQPRKCSYCESILEDCDDHNIRTCTNMLSRGKSPYTEYSEGKFKLLHVKGLSSEEIGKQHCIFTYYEDKLDVENTTNMDRQSIATSFNQSSNISSRVNVSDVSDCTTILKRKFNIVIDSTLNV